MSEMTPRAILASNLRKLIGDESVRSWALARGLDVRLIDRMTKGDNAPTLDKIDEVAAACGIPAWQLLLPEFEPGQTIDAPLTSGERDLLKRLKALLT